MAVLYGLPGSPDTDSIPFPAAIVLSVIVFIAAVIRLGGYFLPLSNQPLQLTVCVIYLPRGIWPSSWLRVNKKWFE
jgi:hypothetical protein